MGIINLTKFMEASKPKNEVDEGELSEDTLEEMKENDRSKFSLKWEGLDKIKAPASGKVIVVYPGSALAMLRILFDDNLTEVASVEAQAEWTSDV